MIGKILQLECAGYSRNITAEDRRKSMLVNGIGTLMLALALGGLWMKFRSPHVRALMPMAYMAPYLFSLRYTSLKGRSAASQTVFTFVVTAAFLLFFLALGYVAERI